MEYTKREWKIGGNNHVFVEGYGAIADCFSDEANAQLIAAAPELYEACKLALEFFVEYDAENKVVSGLSLQLNEAVTKAEDK